MTKAGPAGRTGPIAAEPPSSSKAGPSQSFAVAQAAVPDVVGLPAANALFKLEHEGFGVDVQWRTEAGHGPDETCTVLAQRPGAGSRPTAPAPRVTILVLLDPADPAGTEWCRATVRPAPVAPSASGTSGSPGRG